MGSGYASQILSAIKTEALARGMTTLTLLSTPNAMAFYQRHGFTLLRETVYPSALAGDLLCMEMQASLRRTEKVTI